MECHVCEIVKRKDEQNLIFETEFWGVILSFNQRYLGRCYLFTKRDVGSMSDMTEEENVDFLEVVKKVDIYLDGYWQNEKYFLEIREDILKDFTPRESNTLEVEKYLEQINSTNSISIHVRRGDYAKHPEIGILDISYYQDAVNYINDRVESPTFYIFSNDLKWCEENFNFINTKVFVNKTKSEIEDMILMKSCQHNIIANSSFSWWSAWLNINAKKIIVAPKKWMAINPNKYKWSPLSWIEK